MLYAFLLSLICKLIKKHDVDKKAWGNNYKVSSSSASSSKSKHKLISFDCFIGKSDQEIKNICVKLQIPLATTRNGNMGSIIQHLQENQMSLKDIGFAETDSEEEQQSESSKSSHEKDPDYEQENEEIIHQQEQNDGYYTENEEEDNECLETYGDWNYFSANIFQAALITLLHFSIGGQRKQVIEFMTIYVSFSLYFTENVYVEHQI